MAKQNYIIIFIIIDLTSSRFYGEAKVFGSCRWLVDSMAKPKYLAVADGFNQTVFAAKTNLRLVSVARLWPSQSTCSRFLGSALCVPVRRNMCRLVNKHVYRHVYRHVQGHVQGHVDRHA